MLCAAFLFLQFGFVIFFLQLEISSKDVGEIEFKSNDESVVLLLRIPLHDRRWNNNAAYQKKWQNNKKNKQQSFLQVY